jgi:hypothetical protein
MMAIHNRYEEVIDGATNFPMRDIAMFDQSRPTDKPKAHREAAY